MNPESIAALRASWVLVAPHAELVADGVYAHFFANDPSTIALFARVNLRTHQTSLMSAIGALVGALDDPDALVAIVGPLGRRHAAYHVEERHFEHFREALLDALAHVLGPRFSAEHRAAWTEAFTLIASLMLRAMQRQSTTPVNSTSHFDIGQ
jgi:hemoglobin-like flavoprotein